MLDVRAGPWSELGGPAAELRRNVFIEEQRIQAGLAQDEADARCLHAVAFNRLGLALGTGRLLVEAPGVARIGRLAVLQPMRGSGVGRRLLEALMAAARERGDHEVVLFAQASAAPFYARAGFTPRGEPREEAGVAHIEMARMV
jgi:predicted GNAT family N-acyltransferase